MTLNSKDLKIDETNNMLSRIPGLGLSSNVVKMVGGNNGSIDPVTLQVEDTNAAVVEVLGEDAFPQLGQVKKPKEEISEANVVKSDAMYKLVLAMKKKGMDAPKMANGLALLINRALDDALSNEEIADVLSHMRKSKYLK